MLSEFDYFGEQAVQTSVEDEYIVAVDPVNVITQENPITFEWNGAEATALSLKDTKLMVRLQMNKASGAVLKNDGSEALGAPVNNIMHSVFESMDLEINGTSVCESDKLYPYRAYFENLLSYSADTLGTRGHLEGWHPDTSTKFNDYKIVDTANVGQKARCALFAKGDVETFIGRPHLDLFHQERCIPPGCRLKLTLTPSKNKFCTLSKDSTEAFIMKVVSAKLLLRAKRMSPGLALAQEKMLMQSNFRFPYTKVKMHRHTLKTGATGYDLPNVFTGQIPTRIIFGIAHNEAVSGEYGKNPFEFLGGHLTGVYLTVNGDRVPRNGIKLNFADSPLTDVAEGYISLFEAMDLDLGDKSLSIKPTDWQSGYTIFGFRLAPEPVGTGIWSVPRQGSVDIHLDYSSAPATALDLIILSEYPALLEIDRFRNVVV